MGFLTNNHSQICKQWWKPQNCWTQMNDKVFLHTLRVWRLSKQLEHSKVVIFWGNFSGSLYEGRIESPKVHNFDGLHWAPSSGSESDTIIAIEVKEGGAESMLLLWSLWISGNMVEEEELDKLVWNCDLQIV